MKKVQALLIVSLVFILAGCGKISVNNPQTESQTNQAQKEEIAVEEIDRKKGDECITDGPDERYKNLPPASESHTYTDPFSSISLNFPYNKNWEFDGCEIGPFTQMKNGEGVIVFFGQPNSWGPDQFKLLINKTRSVEDIKSELAKAGDSVPEDQMKETTIAGFNAFRWQENEMTEQIFIEIIGREYNYKFVSGLNDEKKLIKVIESMKVLQ